jgi:SAM-dependent methyltransferase
MLSTAPSPLSNSQIEIARHNVELHENLRYWQRKPLLREEYRGFYREIAARLDGLPGGPILECGSGIGNLKSALPHAITSDLFPNPWLDRQENVYHLGFENESVSAVVLVDVFHHLEFPGTVLDELARVVRPGGRVVLFEPAMGFLGRLALGLFHHEPLGLDRPIRWRAASTGEAKQSGYYAAQGNAWRVFARREQTELSGWNVEEISYYPALTWLLCGGFRGPMLLGPKISPLAKGLDRLLSRFPRLFASRMLVVLSKPHGE